MSDSQNLPVYSIAAVSKLTGISCHALRVWERRYGFPVPHRLISGHRRFTHEQVNILQQLSRLVVSGQSIGELIGEFQSGQLDLQSQDRVKVEKQSVSTLVIERLFEGDVDSAEAMIDRIAERVSPLELIERVIEPALVEIGERWFRGEIEVYQERCTTVCLLGRLGRLVDQAKRANTKPTRTALIGSVQGDRHDGGIMMISVALEVSGWRAVSMGSDLPIDEFRKAVDTFRPDALALSFVLSRNINKRFEELAKIRGVPIFVGGRSIINHQGLARRHGLIPLQGSLKASSFQLTEEVEARKRRANSSSRTI